MGTELVNGEGPVRRHCGHAETRGHIETDSVRQSHHTGGGHDRKLLSRAGRSLVRGKEQPHSITDLEAGDVSSYGIDDTRAILIRYHLREVHRSVDGGAGLPVGRVHSRDGHADPRLVRPRRSGLALAQCQN